MSFSKNLFISKYSEKSNVKVSKVKYLPVSFVEISSLNKYEFDPVRNIEYPSSAYE